MVERGGPTTQAGIEYQNLVAALYLGDLLRLDDDGRDRVTEVRVEAPAHVDDIVVRYADHHRRWLQAKLDLKVGDPAWKALWRNFVLQLQDADFGVEDRLGLVLGTESDLARKLKACADITNGSHEAQWRGRQNVEQSELIERIESDLGVSAYDVFARLTVEVLPEEAIRRDQALHRMPRSNLAPQSLLDHLQVAAGGAGRRRESFRAADLRQRLREAHAVRFDAPQRWGLQAYLTSLEAMRIDVPGTSVGGPAAASYAWPRTALTDEAHSDFDDEQTLDAFDLRRVQFDLRVFPSPQYAQCIVHAGPGFGKSALLAAIAQRLTAEGIQTPAIVSLGELADTKLSVVDYLQTSLNTQHTVNIDWVRLCETGTAVVLFDGLDEIGLGERTEIVQRVTLFTRRFPQTPWLLTVRDPAVVPGGFDAPKVELLPMSREDMEPFMRGVRPELSEDDLATVLEQVEVHPDLERLVRIPLFLALLVAIWRPGSPIPTQRSQLIEAYLKTLFRPEEFKTTPRVAAPERLQRALQDLAFQLLDRGEIGASEGVVRRVLAHHAGEGLSGERLFDDALRCGVLRRPGSARLAFPFPIVQEYLAALEMVEHHADQIPSRAARAAERPWAQAVQFALEQLPDSSSIARTMLASPPDAFATDARLLARCILNGMRCDAVVRLEVGEKLAETWIRQSYWTSKRIGQMLRDGWADPPSAQLRKALHRSWLLHSGAGEILADLADPALTLSVLEALMRRPTHLAHLWAFQPAVTAVSTKALDIYVEAVRRRPDEGGWAVANLIVALDGSAIGPARLLEVARDEGLPPSVRVAAWSLVGVEPDDLYWSLANPQLQSETASDQWAAIRALRTASQPEHHLRALLRREDLSDATRFNVLDQLREVLPDMTRRLDFLRAEAAAAELSEVLRFRLQFYAAAAGDRETFESLLVKFEQMPAEWIAHVLRCVNHYRLRADGERVVAALRRREFSGADRAYLAAELVLGATHIIETQSYDTALPKAAPPHPSYPEFVGLIAEWREAASFHLDDQLHMEVTAAQARVPGALEELRRLTTRIALEEDVRHLENPLNGTIRAAVDELARQRQPLDLSVAIHLAEHSDSNAEIGALYHIAAIGSREALDYLIARCGSDHANHSVIFQGIETIATRLDLKIVEHDGRLSIDSTTSAASSS